MLAYKDMQKMLSHHSSDDFNAFPESNAAHIQARTRGKRQFGFFQSSNFRKSKLLKGSDYLNLLVLESDQNLNDYLQNRTKTGVKN
jgi:hypothetical protein